MSTWHTHPDLDTDCLYDHVHIYKNLVHILAKRLKDVTLNRTNPSPRWSRTSPDPAKPARHASRNSIPPSTSSRAPSRTSALREEPHRQRLLYKSPTAPPPLTPPEPERQSYAQAVSGVKSSQVKSPLFISAFNNTNCNKALHNIKIGKFCQ